MENDSMTDQQEAYHNATINGETPETLDPRHNTGSFRSPGLKKCDISTGEVGAPAGPSGIHLVVTLYFDSLDAIKAGLASPQRQARGRRSCQLCGRGAELYFFDTKDV
jgi:hypothetical protein